MVCQIFYVHHFSTNVPNKHLKHTAHYRLSWLKQQREQAEAKAVRKKITWLKKYTCIEMIYIKRSVSSSSATIQVYRFIAGTSVLMGLTRAN